MDWCWTDVGLDVTATATACGYCKEIVTIRPRNIATIGRVRITPTLPPSTTDAADDDNIDDDDDNNVVDHSYFTEPSLVQNRRSRLSFHRWRWLRKS